MTDENDVICVSSHVGPSSILVQRPPEPVFFPSPFSARDLNPSFPSLPPFPVSSWRSELIFRKWFQMRRRSSGSQSSPALQGAAHVELPAIFSDWLTDLDLSCNDLGSVPASVCQLKLLQRLDLSGSVTALFSECHSHSTKFPPTINFFQWPFTHAQSRHWIEGPAELQEIQSN